MKTMNKIDKYILVHRQSQGTVAKNQIMRNLSFLCGSEILETYNVQMHVISHPDQLRGLLITPDQVHISGGFWEGPLAEDIMDQLRSILAFTAMVTVRS